MNHSNNPLANKSAKVALVFCIVMLYSLSGCFVRKNSKTESWIRINQLGYVPQGVKVAVWVSKDAEIINEFALYNAKTNKQVFKSESGANFGEYGPFKTSYRLNFTNFKTAGDYYLKAGNAKSPVFKIDEDVYKGAADFVLRYMRQQRSLFNPFLQDSCHTHDGFTLYAEGAGIPDSTHIDAGGGWHDASDYLQYATTSANATYHLLAAYRDFPDVFEDDKQANGLVGSNGIADVLDEAKWGLDWLLKLHPAPNLMFNQVADDRDHASLRLPKEDPFYGRGFERPVYFIDGNPQQRGKFMNNTTGTSSTAAKFVSAFNLGSDLFKQTQPSYSNKLEQKAKTALDYAHIKLGVTQTVSVASPYIYEEVNWKDDMQLAFATMYGKYGDLNFKKEGLKYAREEPVTEWMIRDTASHYQYYPFINLGHYELAKHVNKEDKAELVSYYKKGIDLVWNRAKENAFYRGVPFIWCSNNLTVSFAIQCNWYQDLTGDNGYEELAQANFDWLFGLNPWGTSMVYGLPSWGDTPIDPHSAFTHIAKLPIDGGLVDGPIYTKMFNSLIGIKLYNEDAYAQFQSDLAVYHDDFGDYSTNEPTMDGTASLVYLMASMEQKQLNKGKNKRSAKATLSRSLGGMVRGDTTKKEIALIFSAHEFNEGKDFVQQTLDANQIKSSFFLTGNFYRNPENEGFIKKMKAQGHYLGAHSDQHLLYNDWEKRDSLLVSQKEFSDDLRNNYDEMRRFGIEKDQAHYFLPPYEWYNSTISNWVNKEGLSLINFSSGTRSTADYTWPEMGKRYLNSDDIYRSIFEYEKNSTAGLNGFVLLVHLGTDPRRTDKFYLKLPELLKTLKNKGYSFVRIDAMFDY